MKTISVLGFCVAAARRRTSSGKDESHSESAATAVHLLGRLEVPRYFIFLPKMCPWVRPHSHSSNGTTRGEDTNYLGTVRSGSY